MQTHFPRHQDADFFMDAIGDGIIVVDTKGKIVKTNLACCLMLGYDKKCQIEGQEVLKLLSAIDEKGQPINKKNAAFVKSIKLGKRINNALRQFIKSDQTRMWAAITTTPLKNEKQRVNGAIIVIRDITEEHQQEEYRTDFAHIASHTLRTPLGNVLWATEYLLKEKEGKLNQTQKDYLSESYQTLKAMNTMVNDLLSVSRLPDKKVKPHFTKVNLQEVTEEILRTYQAYAHAKNVSLKLSSSCTKPFIKADPEYLKIIIRNLLENGVRYSANKSTVILKIYCKNDEVFFSCTNSGIGIPKNKQKFIFAKFFRAPNAVKKEGNGTGLGLYITKEMVLLNKGSIWFESEVNKETTFYVKFKQQ